MKKIGILTFHYSNNYGGVLQAFALQKVLESKGCNVEIINFIPSSYSPSKIIRNLGIKKNIFKNNLGDANPIILLKKLYIMVSYNKKITREFDRFRSNEMNLSKKVDSVTIKHLLNDYDVIIVGSDQIWNPSQRTKPEYFLDFKTDFIGKKISYAADSTIAFTKEKNIESLSKILNDFDAITIRNNHSRDFVKDLIGKSKLIVSDPTLLLDFKQIHISTNLKLPKEYILVYVLGKEIIGSHKETLKKIKNVYGNIPVISIKIPTMNFSFSHFADKTFYSVNPYEWLSLFRNAKFVYTDSFHGVLFSLKYHKNFLAYYTDKMRATRFIDISTRYNIDRYIVSSMYEIENKESIIIPPNFSKIDAILNNQINTSLDFIDKMVDDFL